jgi:predicted nucleotidyltransferase
MTEAARLAERIAARLGEIAGVVGVTLGGSVARGTGDEASDLDLGIYYRPYARPAIQALRTLAQTLDDRHLPNLATAYGEWGRWIDGGAWLTIEGRRVDWLYRDLDRVRGCIAAGEAGQVVIDYQPGHPHGFASHIYAGELHLGRVLFDPDGVLAVLKQRVAVYPSALRGAIVGRFLWEARFSLDLAAKPVARGDVAYVAGCTYRCVASLLQALFALNGQYLVNEKGALREARDLPVLPVDFAERAEAVLGDLGTTPTQLGASLSLLSVLVRQIQDVADGGAR